MKAPKKERVEEYLSCDSFCPWCGSENIRVVSQMEVDVTIAWRSVKCDDCGREWQDEYSLIGISWLVESGDRVHSDEMFKEKEGSNYESGDSKAR